VLLATRLLLRGLSFVTVSTSRRCRAAAPMYWPDGESAPLPPLTSVSFQEVRGLYSERFGDPDQHKDAGVPPAAFDATRIGEIDLCFEGELFLRQPSRLARPAHIDSDDRAPVSHVFEGRPQGIYSLGTIVLIRATA